MIERYPIFDSHCHLDDPRFDEDREAVLETLREEQVLCTCVGSDMPSSARVVALAERVPIVFAAVGMHPHEARFFAEQDMRNLREWVKSEKVVAIGEIGLDYFYDKSPRDVQRAVFVQQLELAVELQYPAILHIRDAHGEALEILHERKGHLPQLIIHCYSGSRESAREYLDLGSMISFAGPVTYKNSAHLREAAAYVPIDRLLIETDSPYLAPQAVRGQRNQPNYVRFVAEEIARLKETTPQELAAVTRENALRVYRISSEKWHV